MPQTCLHCRFITGSVRLTRSVRSLCPVATFQMPMVCSTSRPVIQLNGVCSVVSPLIQLNGVCSVVLPLVCTYFIP